MKKFENIVMSEVEPSTNSLWLKDGKLLYFDGGWKPCYEEPEEVKVPTRVSQLSNDVGYVKSINLAPVVTNHGSMKLSPEIVNNLGFIHLYSYRSTVLYAGHFTTDKNNYLFVTGFYTTRYPGDSYGLYTEKLIIATWNAADFNMTFKKEIVLTTQSLS